MILTYLQYYYYNDYFNVSCFHYFSQEAEKAGGTDEKNDFFKFEKCLARSAKEKKGKLLTKQANSVISKAKNALSQFKAYVDKRLKATNERHADVISTLESGIEKFKKKEQKKYDTFGENEIKTMLEKFETGVRKMGKSETEMLQNFCIEANKKIKEVIAQNTEIAKRFDEWKVEMKLSKRIRFNWVLPKNVPQLNYQDLKNDRHRPLFDVHAYLTNNYLMTATAVGTLAFGASLAGTK